MEALPASPVERIIRGEAFDFFRGRVALYALLEVMGVGPGDEVIIQAFTCLAVPAPILAIGAIPVYVDAAPGSLNMDPAAVEVAITGKTRAIIVQHSFGVPGELESLLSIARRHDLYLIEDCAHTLAATYDDRPVGTFGHAAFHSYEWGKPVITGLGGTALLNDKALNEKMAAVARRFGSGPWRQTVLVNAQYAAFRMIVGSSLYWSIRDAYRYLARLGLTVGSFSNEEMVGLASPDYRRRMAPMLRRRLVRKLRTLEHDTARRDRLAAKLSLELKLRGFRLPLVQPRVHPVYIKFPVYVGNKGQLIERARRDHIELYDMFVTPIHPLPPGDWARVGYRTGSCPIAESLSAQIVSIPMHARMTAGRMGRILEYLAVHAEPISV
ncbi:MAG: DegT/DnrJ/EryC1/StrS aminotransferase [Gemmatimonadales bacterium]|nr:DegT/DnrJ/EryC1/StrS aminotransferase [Gemmatimonadales bacterium]